MAKDLDKKFARSHAGKALADGRARGYQESIYAPGSFSAPAGPFGAATGPINSKNDGIVRFRGMPLRLRADQFLADGVPQRRPAEAKVGLGVLRPEELEGRPIPRIKDRAAVVTTPPLLPCFNAEQRRQNCAVIDPGDKRLNVVRRDAWPSGKPRGKLDPQEGTYDTITFHHTGRQKTAGAVAGLHVGAGIRGGVELAARKAYNTVSANKVPTYEDFADIGYHFMIDRNGKVYEGRGVANVGAHVKGDNKRNLGVAFLGDYTNSPVTGAQLQAAYNLTEIARNGGEVKRIATHGEFDSGKANELKGAIAQLRCLVR